MSETPDELNVSTSKAVSSRPRRRATRRTAAPEEQLPTTTETAEAEEVAAETAPEEVLEVAQPVAEQPEPDAEPESETEPKSETEPEPDTELEPEEDPEAEAEEEPAPPAGLSFGLFSAVPQAQPTKAVQFETPAVSSLLFQAPIEAPAPRRSRPARPVVDEVEDTESDAPEDQVTDSDEQSESSAEHSEDGGDEERSGRRRRRRGGRGRRGRNGEDSGNDDDSSSNGEDDDSNQETSEGSGKSESDSANSDADSTGTGDSEGSSSSSRRRRRRRRGDEESGSDSEVSSVRGSTRLEAKRQRRRDGRDAGRRRQTITEAEFLARRESVDRQMLIRERSGLVQIAVLEDGVLVEHFISSQAKTSMVGNVYLGRVQNVLPSMEAAFVDVGKGRNAVLYAGEVNWDAAGLEGQPRRIELALKTGDPVLVQVTKDPIGHKGARLTSQITLAGRHLVLVPGGGVTGISRKLPDAERNRLKHLLKEILPDGVGVIVRTAAEGATEEELRADVSRLTSQWERIESKQKQANPPKLLQGEPDLAIRVVRDLFNSDFTALVVDGNDVWETVSEYLNDLAPELIDKLSKWTGSTDVFAPHRIDEQLTKALSRKVWLPSGGSLVIDRTEAMTVIDVNTGKFVGTGGTLEETVTRNNLEAAEEIVRQLRLRDIGGIIVIDFIDMVLESNRDLVLRRLTECLSRDRTKHQVAEVTSLGLVQMTRKRVGQGLAEAFGDSEPDENGLPRNWAAAPATESATDNEPKREGGRRSRGQRGENRSDNRGESRSENRGESRAERSANTEVEVEDKTTAIVLPEASPQVVATLATIAAAAAQAHDREEEAAAAEAGQSNEETGEVGAASSLTEDQQ